MKKLNNKGYMLVEIILASVIAFGVAYFILDLVIKLKNKNDDLFVDTLARTDQAIITNTIIILLVCNPAHPCKLYIQYTNINTIIPLYLLYLFVLL